jgi:Concanavalin A-like lectin/glucanases superfamily
MHRSTTTAILSLLLFLSLWPCSGQAQAPVALVNPQAPGLRGLVTWWRGVPGLVHSPRWYDLMGRSHGTLVGMGTTGAGSGWGVSDRPGGLYHVRCDGTNDYISAPAPRLAGGRYTLMFWAKDNMSNGSFNLEMAYAATNFKLSLNKGNWGGASQAISVTLNNGPFYDLGPALSLPLGAWVHIAVTLDTASNLSRGFVNGRLTGSGGYEETFGGTPQLLTFCNRETTFGTWANGAYDDFRIYNRALTPEEVWQTYLASRQGDPQIFRPPLLALGLAPSGALGSFLPFFGQP